MNVNEAMSAEETQEWLYAIGSAEEESTFMARDFALYLERQGICEEKQLKEWAIGQLLWERDWPGPRSIWQEITKGATAHEGKKTRWKILWEKREDTPVRIFRIEWGSEFSLYQEFELSLIAGLGKIAGILASRKKRNGNSTVPGNESSTNSTTSVTSSTTSSIGTGTTSSIGTEVEKLKQENSSLYKEVENLRAVQAEIYDKAKQEFVTAIKEAENREILAGKAADAAKAQAESMDEAIIAALSILNKAKSTQGSTELFALIEEAKQTLGNAPKMTLGVAE